MRYFFLAAAVVTLAFAKQSQAGLLNIFGQNSGQSITSNNGLGVNLFGEDSSGNYGGGLFGGFSGGSTEGLFGGLTGGLNLGINGASSVNFPSGFGLPVSGGSQTIKWQSSGKGPSTTTVTTTTTKSTYVTWPIGNVPGMVQVVSSDGSSNWYVTRVCSKGTPGAKQMKNANGSIWYLKTEIYKQKPNIPNLPQLSTLREIRRPNNIIQYIPYKPSIIIGNRPGCWKIIMLDGNSYYLTTKLGYQGQPGTQQVKQPDGTIMYLIRIISKSKPDDNLPEEEPVLECPGPNGQNQYIPYGQVLYGPNGQQQTEKNNLDEIVEPGQKPEVRECKDENGNMFYLTTKPVTEGTPGAKAYPSPFGGTWWLKTERSVISPLGNLPYGLPLIERTINGIKMYFIAGKNSPGQNPDGNNTSALQIPSLPTGPNQPNSSGQQQPQQQLSKPIVQEFNKPDGTTYWVQLKPANKGQPGAEPYKLPTGEIIYVYKVELPEKPTDDDSEGEQVKPGEIVEPGQKPEVRECIDENGNKFYLITKAVPEGTPGAKAYPSPFGGTWWLKTERSVIKPLGSLPYGLPLIERTINGIKMYFIAGKNSPGQNPDGNNTSAPQIPSLPTGPNQPNSSGQQQPQQQLSKPIVQEFNKPDGTTYWVQLKPANKGQPGAEPYKLPTGEIIYVYKVELPEKPTDDDSEGEQIKPGEIVEPGQKPEVRECIDENENKFYLITKAVPEGTPGAKAYPSPFGGTWWLKTERSVIKPLGSLPYGLPLIERTINGIKMYFIAGKNSPGQNPDGNNTSAPQIPSLPTGPNQPNSSGQQQPQQQLSKPIVQEFNKPDGTTYWVQLKPANKGQPGAEPYKLPTGEIIYVYKVELPEKPTDDDSEGEQVKPGEIVEPGQKPEVRECIDENGNKFYLITKAVPEGTPGAKAYPSLFGGTWWLKTERSVIKPLGSLPYGLPLIERTINGIKMYFIAGKNSPGQNPDGNNTSAPQIPSLPTGPNQLNSSGQQQPQQQLSKPIVQEFNKPDGTTYWVQLKPANKGQPGAEPYKLPTGEIIYVYKVELPEKPIDDDSEGEQVKPGEIVEPGQKPEVRECIDENGNKFYLFTKAVPEGTPGAKAYPSPFGGTWWLKTERSVIKPLGSLPYGLPLIERTINGIKMYFIAGKNSPGQNPDGNNTSAPQIPSLPTGPNQPNSSGQQQPQQQLSKPIVQEFNKPDGTTYWVQLKPANKGQPGAEPYKLPTGEIIYVYKVELPEKPTDDDSEGEQIKPGEIVEPGQKPEVRECIDENENKFYLITKAVPEGTPGAKAYPSPFGGTWWLKTERSVIKPLGSLPYGLPLIERTINGIKMYFIAGKNSSGQNPDGNNTSAPQIPSLPTGPNQPNSSEQQQPQQQLSKPIVQEFNKPDGTTYWVQLKPANKGQPGAEPYKLPTGEIIYVYKVELPEKPIDDDSEGEQVMPGEIVEPGQKPEVRECIDENGNKFYLITRAVPEGTPGAKAYPSPFGGTWWLKTERSVIKPLGSLPYGLPLIERTINGIKMYFIAGKNSPGQNPDGNNTSAPQIPSLPTGPNQPNSSGQQQPQQQLSKPIVQEFNKPDGTTYWVQLKPANKGQPGAEPYKLPTGEIIYVYKVELPEKPTDDDSEGEQIKPGEIVEPGQKPEVRECIDENENKFYLITKAVPEGTPGAKAYPSPFGGTWWLKTERSVIKPLGSLPYGLPLIERTINGIKMYFIAGKNSPGQNPDGNNTSAPQIPSLPTGPNQPNSSGQQQPQKQLSKPIVQEFNKPDGTTYWVQLKPANKGQPGAEPYKLPTGEIIYVYKVELPEKPTDDDSEGEQIKPGEIVEPGQKPEVRECIDENENKFYLITKAVPEGTPGAKAYPSPFGGTWWLKTERSVIKPLGSLPYGLPLIERTINGIKMYFIAGKNSPGQNPDGNNTSAPQIPSLPIGPNQPNSSGQQQPQQQLSKPIVQEFNKPDGTTYWVQLKPANKGQPGAEPYKLPTGEIIYVYKVELPEKPTDDDSEGEQIKPGEIVEPGQKPEVRECIDENENKFYLITKAVPEGTPGAKAYPSPFGGTWWLKTERSVIKPLGSLPYGLPLIERTINGIKMYFIAGKNSSGQNPDGNNTSAPQIPSLPTGPNQPNSSGQQQPQQQLSKPIVQEFNKPDGTTYWVQLKPANKGQPGAEPYKLPTGEIIYVYKVELPEKPIDDDSEGEQVMPGEIVEPGQKPEVRECIDENGNKFYLITRAVPEGTPGAKAYPSPFGGTWWLKTERSVIKPLGSLPYGLPLIERTINGIKMYFIAGKNSPGQNPDGNNTSAPQIPSLPTGPNQPNSSGQQQPQQQLSKPIVQEFNKPDGTTYWVQLKPANKGQPGAEPYKLPTGEIIYVYKVELPEKPTDDDSEGEQIKPGEIVEPGQKPEVRECIDENENKFYLITKAVPEGTPGAKAYPSPFGGTWWLKTERSVIKPLGSLPYGLPLIERTINGIKMYFIAGKNSPGQNPDGNYTSAPQIPSLPTGPNQPNSSGQQQPQQQLSKPIVQEFNKPDGTTYWVQLKPANKGQPGAEPYKLPTGEIIYVYKVELPEKPTDDDSEGEQVKPGEIVKPGQKPEVRECIDENGNKFYLITKEVPEGTPGAKAYPSPFGGTWWLKTERSVIKPLGSLPYGLPLIERTINGIKMYVIAGKNSPGQNPDGNNTSAPQIPSLPTGPNQPNSSGQQQPQQQLSKPIVQEFNKPDGTTYWVQLKPANKGQPGAEPYKLPTGEIIYVTKVTLHEKPNDVDSEGDDNIPIKQQISGTNGGVTFMFSGSLPPGFAKNLPEEVAKLFGEGKIAEAFAKLQEMGIKIPGMDMASMLNTSGGSVVTIKGGIKLGGTNSGPTQNVGNAAPSFDNMSFGDSGSPGSFDKNLPEEVAKLFGEGKIAEAFAKLKEMGIQIPGMDMASMLNTSGGSVVTIKGGIQLGGKTSGSTQYGGNAAPYVSNMSSGGSGSPGSAGNWGLNQNAGNAAAYYNNMNSISSGSPGSAGNSINWW